MTNPTTTELALTLEAANKLVSLARTQEGAAANRLAIRLAESVGIEVGKEVKGFVITIIRADLEVVKQATEEFHFPPVSTWDQATAPSLFVRIYGERIRDPERHNTFLGGFKSSFFQELGTQQTKE